MSRLASLLITLWLMAVVTLTSFSPTFFVSAKTDERRVEFISPTGSYAVGRSTFRWIDQTRAEAMTSEPDDHRELVAYLWYPAAPTTQERAAYIPDLSILKKVIRGPEAGAWQKVQTHSFSDAPLSSSQPKYPVLILSPGNDMNSTLYSFLIEELVSHGYVVVGLDHPYDSRAVVLSTGKVVGLAQDKWPPLPKQQLVPNQESDYSRFYHERVKTRAQDASFALSQLEKLNLDQGSRLRGHLDLERVGFLGHSVGGVAAGKVCQLDQRFKACLNLDGITSGGPFYLDEHGRGFDQPYLLLTKPFRLSSEKLAELKLSREEWEANRERHEGQYFRAVKAGSYKVAIEGATHQSFSDDALLLATLLKPQELAAHKRRAQIIREYTRAFFDKYLKGTSVSLLDVASPQYPEVQVEVWRPEGKSSSR